MAAPKGAPAPEEQAIAVVPRPTKPPRQTALQALINASPNDVVVANPDREIIKGTANPANATIHGPASTELSAIADGRLTKCARPEHLKDQKVQRVYAQYITSAKLVVLNPARPDDLEAMPVNRYVGGSSSWVNLITLLSEVGMTVESGHRERYDVGTVPEASPFAPGIFIDLGKRRDRRLESKKLTEEEKAEKAKQKAERQQQKAEKAAQAQAAKAARAAAKSKQPATTTEELEDTTSETEN